EADGAGAVDDTEAFRERAVGSCFAVGNLLQQIPHAKLEIAADERERQIKFGELAREVGLQLADRLEQWGRILAPSGARTLGTPAGGKADQAQAARVGGEKHSADGAFVAGVADFAGRYIGERMFVHRMILRERWPLVTVCGAACQWEI